MRATSIHHLSLAFRIINQYSSLLLQTIEHSKQKEPDSSIQAITHVSHSFIPKIDASNHSPPPSFQPYLPHHPSPHPSPSPLPLSPQTPASKIKIKTNLPLPPRRHHINESPRIRNPLLRPPLWCLLLLLRLNLNSSPKRVSKTFLDAQR